MGLFNNQILSIGLLCIFLFSSCRSQKGDQQIDFYRVYGQTMGTTYSVVYQGIEDPDLKEEIDSVLIHVNNVMSTYIPTSTISRVNDSSVEFDLSQEKFFAQNWFRDLMKTSQTVYLMSDGFFDPTVMPLVNYWGFGFKEREFDGAKDQLKIDSILTFIGFDKLKFEDNIITKPENLQLDFSALAKGYGVDIVVEFLIEKGLENVLVEIGGETRGVGLGRKGEGWILGIATPEEEAEFDDLILNFKLINQSVATSGNYRNFYELDGEKYSHTINPKTGMPERSQLLSATVISEKCVTADAWATAFMAMGLEKSKQILEEHPDLTVILIYNNGSDEIEYFISDQIKNQIIESK